MKKAGSSNNHQRHKPQPKSFLSANITSITPTPFAGKLQIKSLLRRGSRELFATLGSEAFPPNFTEVTENGRKKLWQDDFIDRIILNRSAEKLFCHKFLDFF